MRSVVARAPSGNGRLAADPIRPDDRFVTADIPFRILSRNGYVLGKFDRLGDALSAYNTWAQATAITLGNYVVCERKGGVR